MREDKARDPRPALELGVGKFVPILIDQLECRRLKKRRHRAVVFIRRSRRRLRYRSVLARQAIQRRQRKYSRADQGP